MSVIEQAPLYQLTCQDDGREEKYQLTVQLPGVESAAELDVVVRPTLVSIRVPGRYKLELPMNPPVQEKPELLRFVKKRSQLKAVLVVDVSAQQQPAPGPTPPAAPAPAPTPVPAATAAPAPRPHLSAAALSAKAEQLARASGFGVELTDFRNVARTAGPGALADSEPMDPILYELLSSYARSTSSASTTAARATSAGSSSYPYYSHPYPASSAAATGATQKMFPGPGSRAATVGNGPAPASASAVPAANGGVDSRRGSTGSVPGTGAGNGTAGISGHGTGVSASGSSKPAAPSCASSSSSFTRQVHDSFYQDALGLSRGARGAKSGSTQQAKQQQPQQQQQSTPFANGPSSAAAGTGGSSSDTAAANGPRKAGGPAATSTATKQQQQQAQQPSTAPPQAQRQQAQERQTLGAQQGGGTPNGTAAAASTASAATGSAGGASTSGGGSGSGGTSRSGGGSSEELYAAAKQLANREAAQQWLERALSAARQGDAGRAEILLGRAVGLCPGEADKLTAEYNSRCDPDQKIHRRPGQQQGQGQAGKAKQGGPGSGPGAAPPSSSGAGTAAGAASSSAAAGGAGKPQNGTAASAQGQPQGSKPKASNPQEPQQQQQQDGPGTSGPSGRPSQPYSYTKPAAERVRPEPSGASGSSKPAGGASAGASGASSPTGGAASGRGAGGAKSGGAAGRSTAGAGGSGGGPAKPDAQQARAKPGGQQQQGQGSSPGQAGPGPGAGPSRGGQQQQQQQQTHSPSGFKPEPRARPPPSAGSWRNRSGGGAGGSGGGAGGSAEDEGNDDGAAASGSSQAWDWLINGVYLRVKSVLEPYMAPDRPTWVVWLASGAYWAMVASLMLPHLVIGSLAALAVYLYSALGHRETARWLERRCKKYFRWTLGCAVVMASPIAALLYVVGRPLWALLRVLCGFVFAAPLWVGAAETAALYYLIDYKKRPVLASLAPVPVLCSMGVSAAWRLATLLLYTAAHLAAPGRTRAAFFSGAAVLSWQSLVWYQALPAMLLEFIAWLMLSAAAASDGGSAGGSRARGGGRARGSAGGAGGGGGAGGDEAGGSGWGRGRHDHYDHHHHDEHEGVAGVWLEPEVVKGAAGDIARVLAARDYFSVLGLPCSGAEAEALTDEAVKSAFRRTQLRVHPDKAGPDAAGAAEASQRVNQAYTLLQTTDSRKRLLDKMRGGRGAGRGAGPAGSAASSSAGAGSSAGFGGGGGGGGGSYYYQYGSGDQDSVDMRCWGCHDVHTAKLHTTDRSRARYCYECRTHHAAHDNEMWVWEDPNAFFFPARKLLVCLNGVVWDVTELGNCANMFHDAYGKRLPGNTHSVQYKLGSKPNKGGGGGGADQFRGRGDKGGAKGRRNKRR